MNVWRKIDILSKTFHTTEVLEISVGVYTEGWKRLQQWMTLLLFSNKAGGGNGGEAEIVRYKALSLFCHA